MKTATCVSVANAIGNYFCGLSRLWQSFLRDSALFIVTLYVFKCIYHKVSHYTDSLHGSTRYFTGRASDQPQNTPMASLSMGEGQ